MEKYKRLYRIKRKKSIFKNRFFGLGIFILAILGITFYFLIFSEIFQIKKIIVTGEEKVSKEEIKLLIENKLENKILFFKTKSIFLVNSNEIRKDILNYSPQIAKVEIKRGFPDSLSVVIIERLGIANFCQGEQCFLLDNEGIIFEEVSKDNLNLSVIKKLTDNDSSLKLGERVMEKELLSKILGIFSELKKLEILTKEILIVSGERMNVKTLEDWEIYFDPQKDINWQLTKLKVDLQELISPEKRKDLEYIELRFGDFAPFKYKK